MRGASRARRWPGGGALAPDQIYLGDNGRAFCGALRCAGSTAYYTGRDLSGERVHGIEPEDADYMLNVLKSPIPACETCGRTILIERREG